MYKYAGGLAASLIAEGHGGVFTIIDVSLTVVSLEV